MSAEILKPVVPSVIVFQFIIYSNLANNKGDPASPYRINGVENSALKMG